MHLISETARGSFVPAIQKLLPVCFLILITVGCGRSQIVWSSKAESPDGEMVVTARAFANGGLGISGVPATVVNLNYSTGSQAPEKIFVVTNRSKKSSEWTVDAKWISSEHLEIGYNAALQKIEFQAVKWNDVYITYATIQPMPKARGMTKI